MKSRIQNINENANLLVTKIKTTIKNVYIIEMLDEVVCLTDTPIEANLHIILVVYGYLIEHNMLPKKDTKNFSMGNSYSNLKFTNEKFFCEELNRTVLFGETIDQKLLFVLNIVANFVKFKLEV